MSHELRTPLNAILGYTELIVDKIYGEIPPKALTTLECVQANGKHLLGLINDVLDLSKIEAGQINLTLTDYSVKDIVYNVYSAVESLANNKKISPEGRYCAGAPASAWRRTKTHAGIVQSRRQCDQVHRRWRSCNQGVQQQRIGDSRRA